MALRQPGHRAAAVRDPAVSADALPDAASTTQPPPPFPTRFERLDVVPSTNDVVMAWLRDGTPEVCVAVADRQSAGRGRHGRTWLAPAGTALLASIGFRPTWLAPERTWRVAGVVALAMADAAEDVAGLGEGTIRLKWPNDLVVAFGASGRPIGGAASLGPTSVIDVRKLAGLLGETEGLGTAEPHVVVGIVVNADWSREAFPPDLAADMTSLREVSGGRPIDRQVLLDEFLARLETRVEALRGGYFDVAGWTARQLTSGRIVRLEHPDGRAEIVRALGVDATTGGLVVAASADPDREAAADPRASAAVAAAERQVLAGEIRHVRLADSAAGEL